MQDPQPATTTGSQIQQINQRFYDSLWAGVRLIDPSSFNTWPLVKSLADSVPARLEVGPGMRPRLPIEGSHFADISEPALAQLAGRGGLVQTAQINALPYSDNSFDLVCALDIVEHVEDDRGALDELCRVAKPGATLLLSTPMHPGYWTAFDDMVGHYRRYQPEQLKQLLAERQLEVTQSAGYGMKPKSSWLVNLGMHHLRKNPERSLWYYNRIFMPLSLYFQKPLNLQAGMANTDNIGEIFMVCRKT